MSECLKALFRQTISTSIIIVLAELASHRYFAKMALWKWTVLDTVARDLQASFDVIMPDARGSWVYWWPR